MGKTINLLAFNTIPEVEGTVFKGKSVEDVPTQELQDHYADWEPEIRTLFSVSFSSTIDF